MRNRSAADRREVGWVLRLLIVSLILCICVARRSQAHRIQRVLLITVDCLREDYVDDHSHAASIPNMRRLIDAGTSYTHAYAQSETTMAASRWILDTAAGDSMTAGGIRAQPLAERLRRSGFHTAAFLSTFMLWSDASEQGVRPGFELFHCPSPSSQPEWRSGDEATTEAVAWIRQHAADEHWFAWVMIWDIHQARSLLAQGSITAEATDTVYDSGVRSSDRCCGRLLEALKATGQADDTLVVLTGNHGFPHAQTSNHVYGLSEELLHVPLVLWAPGHLSGGRRIDAPVEHGDVTPTVLGLLGLPVQGEIGVNALGPLDVHRPLFAQTCDFKCSSVQMDGWRYIEYDRDLELALPGTGSMSGERGSTWKRAGSAELVDVNDVAGESDVSASHPQVVARMRESLHAWEQRTSRVPRAALLPEPGRPEVELLRKHGYW